MVYDKRFGSIPRGPEPAEPKIFTQGPGWCGATWTRAFKVEEKYLRFLWDTGLLLSQLGTCDPRDRVRLNRGERPDGWPDVPVPVGVAVAGWRDFRWVVHQTDRFILPTGPTLAFGQFQRLLAQTASQALGRSYNGAATLAVCHFNGSSFVEWDIGAVISRELRHRPYGAPVHPYIPRGLRCSPPRPAR